MSLTYQEINTNYSLKDLPGERWRDVKGYDGRYMVSNLGRVKSFIADFGDEKIRKLSVKKHGHLYLPLVKKGKRKNCYVHRLVAEAFLENKKNSKSVRHINGNTQDNRVVNLRWGNHSE